MKINKTIVAIIVILVLIAGSGFAWRVINQEENVESAKEEETKLYRGFPVFPPEDILEVKDKEEFSLEVRGREEVVEEIKRINKEETPITESIEYNGWGGKISEAEKYIKKEAKNYGWEISDSDHFMDGGSTWYLFEKPEEDKAVSVFISNPMIIIAVDGIQLDEKWGIIHYNFNPTDNVFE